MVYANNYLCRQINTTQKTRRFCFCEDLVNKKKSCKWMLLRYWNSFCVFSLIFLLMFPDTILCFLHYLRYMSLLTDTISIVVNDKWQSFLLFSFALCFFFIWRMTNDKGRKTTRSTRKSDWIYWAEIFSFQWCYRMRSQIIITIKIINNN